MPRLTDAALIAGTTLRLTRLVTTDALGDRYARRPVEEWAHRYDHDTHHPTRVYATDEQPRESLPTFLAHGLGCPHCVSFHAAWLTLGSYAVARAVGPRTLGLWRFGAAALTMSAVVGHVSARLDD